MKAFGAYHPVVLITYFVSVILFAMFAQNPVLQLSALLGGALFCLMLQKKREIAGNIGFYVPMFFLVAITNPLFSHNGVTPLFFLNGNPVTLEAFVYGGAIGVCVIGVMLWCKCYSEIMTADKFLYLFARAVPKLSLVLSSALRFIPLFKRRMKEVSRAQRAMGLYSSKSFVDRIKSTMRVFSAMISQSLEASMETSASMHARGYGTKKKRTSFSLFRFSARDGFLLSLCALLCLGTAFGIGFGYTDFYYYPEITHLKVTFGAVLTWSVYAILTFLPFFIELKELLVWKYYISKI